MSEQRGFKNYQINNTFAVRFECKNELDDFGKTFVRKKKWNNYQKQRGGQQICNRWKIQDVVSQKLVAYLPDLPAHNSDIKQAEDCGEYALHAGADHFRVMFAEHRESCAYAIR